MMKDYDHRDVVLEEDEVSMKREIPLRVFITRLVNRYPKKCFWLAFCQFG